MIHHTIINKLKDNAHIIETLLCNISPGQAVWRPAPDKWSLLEVINHLYDEEIDDFRQRLEFALLRPSKAWKRIEPEKWVKEKNYSQRELQASLGDFLREREKSVQWLKGLTSPDWQAKDQYPFGILLTAEQVLANWLAHDFLHIRQINSLNWLYLAKIAPDIDLNYAGTW
jgi:hypothetical protein